MAREIDVYFSLSTAGRNENEVMLSRPLVVALLIVGVCIAAGAKWFEVAPHPACWDHGFSRV